MAFTDQIAGVALSQGSVSERWMDMGGFDGFDVLLGTFWAGISEHV